MELWDQIGIPRDELGDVIRGFNAIQRRVKTIILRTREAEDAARTSYTPQPCRSPTSASMTTGSTLGPARA